MGTSLLLLSNARSPLGYLTHARHLIDVRSRRVQEILFVPYASVLRPWDDFAARVEAELQMAVRPLHRCGRERAAVEAAEMILVGGGNTFHLVHHLRRRELFEPLRAAGATGVPYVGWSAGTNLACPTICTTNDMPIVDPYGLDALGLVPFQINPHYSNVAPAGLMAESRDQRLAEFTTAEPTLPVLGLSEGSWLEVNDGTFVLGGQTSSWWFSQGEEPAELTAGPLLFGPAAAQGSAS